LTHGTVAKLFAAIPRNEIFRLDVNEKKFVLPQLPEQLNGLTIAHLSDLHMTGSLTKSFFEVVAEQTNQLAADLVMIAGDIVDTSACVEWIPETLGRLRAESGVYYVLGNHDKRVRSVEHLRQTLADCGIVGLNGQWREIVVDDTPIVVAGNELPWFGPAPDMTDCPSKVRGQRPLRILLSHTPDQITWAQDNEFDLMLAGHTHGGQIRFPLIGPVVSPSRYGVKYASGVFYERPTLMHVSRGVSGLDLIRWNCRPEITKIILQTSR
jgi:predicted MPP superfamily phosphohydrolase